MAEDPPALDPLAAYAAAAPDRTAVVEDDRPTTFAAFNVEINRLANGLRTLGVQPGERAVWCGPNSSQVLAFMHTCRKLGLVAIPVPYRFTAEEMHHLLADSGAALAVVDVEQAPRIAQLVDAGRLPALRQVVVFRGEYGAFHSWEKIIEEASGEEPPAPETDKLGVAMMYTSGTTGQPKGAVRSSSDRALLAAMLRELNFGRDEVHLTTGPLYHAGPNAFALLAHLTGGTVVVMRRFDPAEWVRLVGTYGVTSTFTGPTQLKRVVDLPDHALATADLSSMRSLIANAAPIPYALKQEVVAKLGDGFLYEVYGSTELGIGTVLRPEDQLRKPGSCGRPYGGIELKVVDDAGNEAPPGQPGELFVKTSLAVDGYHGHRERMAALPTDGDTDAGWWSVGDVGYLDDEGYLHICDRKTDVVITGGANVYPAEVEAVLHAYPDVLDAAVFGVPDEEWGEHVHAVVQPKLGRTIDMTALEEHVSRHLAGYKRPRSWELRGELPRTESGKLLKRVLREEYWRGRPSKV